jgi:hypothetical protein
MTRYTSDDVLTLGQIGEHFGYDRNYLAAITGPTNVHRDPELFRLRIETTPEWREVMGVRDRYVYPYAEVREWHRERSKRAKVQAARRR